MDPCARANSCDRAGRVQAGQDARERRWASPRPRALCVGGACLGLCVGAATVCSTSWEANQAGALQCTSGRRARGTRASTKRTKRTGAACKLGPVEHGDTPACPLSDARIARLRRTPLPHTLAVAAQRARALHRRRTLPVGAQFLLAACSGDRVEAVMSRKAPTACILCALCMTGCAGGD